jgi:hypothetical protein
MEVVTVEPPTLSATLVESIRKIHEIQTELEEALRSDPYYDNDPNLTEEEQKEKDNIHAMERLSAEDLIQGLEAIVNLTRRKESEFEGPSRLIIYLCLQCEASYTIRGTDTDINEIADTMKGMEMDMKG